MKNKGTLYVVATPIGNLQDFSVRAQTILHTVGWIAAEDTRHSQSLLQHYAITTPLISYHQYNEATRTEQLIERLQAGESGALISDAGTPLVSDPGYRLLQAAHAAGLTVSPIPGPCAPIAALSASGLACDKFWFEGFLPATSAARQKRLQQLKDLGTTLIILEAPHRLAAMLEDSLAILGADCQTCVARELTKKFEQIYTERLSQVYAAVLDHRIKAKGEFVLIFSPQVLASEQIDAAEIAKLLIPLLEELPLNQAVKIAARISGLAKNTLYEYGLQLKK